MRRLLLVILGSGFGGGCRYLLGGWVARWLGAAFPYGTLAINVIGSFLIGAVMYVGLNSELITPDARLAVTTGIMGGFTTYSTFNYETLGLFEEGAVLLGLANLAATVVLCLLVGLAGRWVGRALVGA